MEVPRRENRTEAERFEQLYRDNYELVYNYVSYRMAGAQAAEDVTAEAFLKAAKAFRRFDASRSKFSTWVIAIARNCMTDYWRKQRPQSSIDEVSEEAFAFEEDHAVLNDDASRVRQLLASLDDADRELVFLKYYEGKRNVEIARELGMNSSTVATRLQRALLKMRSVAGD